MALIAFNTIAGGCPFKNICLPSGYMTDKHHQVTPWVWIFNLENRMTELVDRIYFQELAGLSPREVCQRALCTYDEAERFYGLSVWGTPYGIYPHLGKIECRGRKSPELHAYFDLFMVHYLLGAKAVETAGQWISEKDIPGGTTFFRGPHAIPTHLISSLFNNNMQGFKNRCEQLKGYPLELADAAFGFEITPRIPVAVLYWAGDEEFPGEAKILYDKTIERHLASDIIYALAMGICQRLGKTCG